MNSSLASFTLRTLHSKHSIMFKNVPLCMLQDVALDLLKAAINGAKNAKGFIIEGYPRVKEQVEDFNKQVSV